MKTVMSALFVAGFCFTGLACEPEDDSPDGETYDGAEMNSGAENDPNSLENCEAPNMVFENTCCSPMGVIAGSCKYDREWTSVAGCRDEYFSGGVQYCCGGVYLPSEGAYGFQCVEIL